MWAYKDSFLFITLLAALCFDSLEGRIPNELVSLELILGGIVRFYENGVVSLMRGIIGVLVYFIFFFMLIKIKCIGAGDVKLIMATSMLIGARRVLMIFLGTSILTLPYTVLLFIKKGIFRERINCFVNYVGKCSVEKRLLEYDMDAPRVPFAIFMFWGAVLERVFAIAGGLVRW